MHPVPKQAAPEIYRAVILGAGVSGLCMGRALRKAGITSFLIIEKSAGIGGTWCDNTYPGAETSVLTFIRTPSTSTPTGLRPMLHNLKSVNIWCDLPRSSISCLTSGSMPR